MSQDQPINAATRFIDSSELAPRVLETPLADWDGGLNEGGTNAPAIGVCTGVINPKLQDWALVTPEIIMQSQIIAGVPSGLGVISPASRIGITAFMEATGAVPVGGIVGTVDGFDMLNITDVDLVAGDRVWAWNSNIPSPATPLTGVIDKAIGTIYTPAVASIDGDPTLFTVGTTFQMAGNLAGGGATPTWDTGVFVSTADNLVDALVEFADFAKGIDDLTFAAVDRRVVLNPIVDSWVVEITSFDIVVA